MKSPFVSSHVEVSPLAANPSVTHWIAGVKAGDAEAARCLWEGYFQRLMTLARSNLGGITRGADAEDVAQSVFKSLCLGATRGKFPRLTDRDDLWVLLVAMTVHKSRDLIRREASLKRGGGRVLNETALENSGEPWGSIDELVGHEPTPAFAAQMAEQCQWLMSRLTDVEQRTAQLKLECFTNLEIAKQMNCGLRTVERRLDAIRRAWTTE
jgi:DNA-directed RNA polymerase specialized sigma24 family protein